MWTTLSNLEVRGECIPSFAGGQVIPGFSGRVGDIVHCLKARVYVAKTLVFEGNGEFEAIKWISSGPIQKSTSNF